MFMLATGTCNSKNIQQNTNPNRVLTVPTEFQSKQFKQSYK